MRQAVRAAIAGAVGFALAGCGIVPGFGPDPRVDAVPVAEAACPETYDDGYAEAGLVPAGFDPVAVVRCEPYGSWEDEAGTWSGAVRERLVGDLEPVLDALAVRSDPRSLAACATIGYVLPELWLESVDGRFVRAAIPTHGCGSPKEVGLDAAISALTVTDETRSAGTLVDSRAATAGGCASQAGLPVIAGLDEIVGLESDSPESAVQQENSNVIREEDLLPYEMPALPSPESVDGAKICEYAVASPAVTGPVPVGDGGLYVGTREMDAVTARAALTAVETAGAPETCTDTATRLVVVHPEGADVSASFTVELDGCRRLIGPDFRPHAAPLELLALLS